METTNSCDMLVNFEDDKSMVEVAEAFFLSLMDIICKHGGSLREWLPGRICVIAIIKYNCELELMYCVRW